MKEFDNPDYFVIPRPHAMLRATTVGDDASGAHGSVSVAAVDETNRPARYPGDRAAIVAVEREQRGQR